MRKILKNIFFLVLIALSLKSCKNKHLVTSYYMSDVFEHSIDTAIYVPYRMKSKWFFVDRRISGAYNGCAKAFESEWDRAFPFNKYNLAKIKKNNFYGYIDTTGNVVIPLRIETELTWDFTDSILVLIDNNNLYGGINISGDTIIPFKYKYLGEFIHNSAVATSVSNEILLLSNKGDILIQPGLYDYLGHASQEENTGVFIYGVKTKDNTLYGILDNNYHKITEPVSSRIPVFSNGLGVIFKNNKYGFINKSGEEIIPCQYNKAEPFFNNVSTISQNNRYGLINSKGDEVLLVEFNDLGICGLQNHIIQAKKNNKWGIIDMEMFLLNIYIKMLTMSPINLVWLEFPMESIPE
jgi:hypothetical protein